VTHIVIVGNGMAGSRLAADLRAGAGSSSRGASDRLRVTVLGAERGPAYNRVLLWDVLAGRLDPADTVLAGSHDRGGTRVTALDVAAHSVQTSCGDQLEYDVLVLATGSRPIIPDLPGVRDATGRLRPGVHTFGSLVDCVALRQEARAARHALVVGGGLAGVHAARGLAALGLPVTLVHTGSHLLPRHLDPAGGRVLRRILTRLGVTIRTGTRVRALTPDQVTATDPDTASDSGLTVVRPAAPVTGAVLDDGEQITADLVVLACGSRPEVTLARAAGLAIGAGGGVLVDTTLQTSAPDVYAIGDCAEFLFTGAVLRTASPSDAAAARSEGSAAPAIAGIRYEQAAPAWDQARVLAARLTGLDPDARYHGSPRLVRLRGDLDVAALGEPTGHLVDADPTAGDAKSHVLALTDATRDAYRKFVIRDDRLVSAVFVGDVATLPDAVRAHADGIPLPSDRRYLMEVMS